jgi:hypothetical protein
MAVQFIRINAAAGPAAQEVLRASRAINELYAALDKLGYQMPHMVDGSNYTYLEGQLGVPAGSGAAAKLVLDNALAALEGNADLVKLRERVG